MQSAHDLFIVVIVQHTHTHTQAAAVGAHVAELSGGCMQHADWPEAIAIAFFCPTYVFFFLSVFGWGHIQLHSLQSLHLLAR